MKKGIICLCLALIGGTVFAQSKGLPELIQGILQHSPALKGQRNLIKMVKCGRKFRSLMPNRSLEQRSA
jgi:hypothetical protein